MAVLVGFIGTQYRFLDSYTSELVQQVSSGSKTFISIIFNNISFALLLIAFGFLFSIVSVYMMFNSGIIVEYVFAKLPLLRGIAYMLPHGIFEIPALLLAVAVSFMITHLECKLINALLHRRLKEEIKQSKKN